MKWTDRRSTCIEAAQSDRATARSAALGVASRAFARPSAPPSASSRARRGPSCPPCSATPRGRVRSIRRALCSEVREVRLTCLSSRHLTSSRHTFPRRDTPLSLVTTHLSLVATHLSLVARHTSQKTRHTILLARCNCPVQVRVESATLEDHIDCFGGSHFRHVTTFFSV